MSRHEIPTGAVLIATQGDVKLYGHIEHVFEFDVDCERWLVTLWTSGHPEWSEQHLAKVWIGSNGKEWVLA